MIDPSELPPELQHLIEKRERADRRLKQRRNSADRREADLGPLGAIEPDDDLDELDLDELDLEEQRSGQDRRGRSERRGKARRRNDHLPDDEDS